MFSDLEGRAAFTVRGGGTCAGGTVDIRADGVPFGSRALASPDQNGDLAVDGADFVLAAGKPGTTDPTADFDCDGVVTTADLDILAGHSGHHALGIAIPIVAGSWGTLKLRYR